MKNLSDQKFERARLARECLAQCVSDRVDSILRLLARMIRHDELVLWTDHHCDHPRIFRRVDTMQQLAHRCRYDVSKHSRLPHIAGVGFRTSMVAAPTIVDRSTAPHSRGTHLTLVERCGHFSITGILIAVVSKQEGHAIPTSICIGLVVWCLVLTYALPKHVSDLHGISLIDNTRPSRQAAYLTCNKPNSDTPSFGRPTDG
ncbi:hypothetical protein ACVIGA_005784 [Bradyrhizobium sp. USDA 3240]